MMNAVASFLELVILLCLAALMITGTVWCVAKVLKSLK